MPKSPWTSSLRWILGLFVLVSTPAALGAACCGGSVAAPAMISGDEKAQASVSIGESQIHADVTTSGFFRERQSLETQRTYQLDVAHIFHDRWQAGGRIKLLDRNREGSSSQGLGDSDFNLGYEYLPDWDYNPIRPKGLGFLQLTLPSGRSIYESQNDFQLDSRGRGFWALGLGTLLSKTWERWDTSILLSIHRSLSKSISTSSGPAELHPGWGGSLATDAGFSWRSFRLGAGANWSYEDGVKQTGSSSSKSSPQRVATAVLSLSFAPSDSWTVMAAYQDQTWLGQPTNTTVSRGGEVRLVRRWSR